MATTNPINIMVRKSSTTSDVGSMLSEHSSANCTPRPRLYTGTALPCACSTDAAFRRRN